MPFILGCGAEFVNHRRVDRRSEGFSYSDWHLHEVRADGRPSGRILGTVITSGGKLLSQRMSEEFHAKAPSRKGTKEETREEELFATDRLFF